MSLYSEASLIVYPSGYKESKIYAQKPIDGSGDLTFARASTATRVNESGLIESVATNVPRIDYTNGCGSLLLEPQRTNLITYSEDFSNAAWTKSNCTLTSLYAPSILDGKNSFLITSTAFNANLATSVSSSNNTQTFFVKKGNWDFVQILNFGSSAAYANFDINNGTLGSKGSFTPSSFISYLGNGWYKISAYFNSSISSTRIYFSNTINDAYGGGASVPIGSTLELAAAQSELGSYPTSYIPTSGTTVTRLQDTSSTTGLSSVIGQTEGTWQVKFTKENIDTYRILTMRNAADTDNLNISTFNDDLRVSCTSGGSSQFDLVVSSAIGSGTFNVAFAYKANDFKVYVNGVSVYTNTSASVPAGMGRIYFSAYRGGNLAFNHRVDAVTLFKTRLTNTELATLTTI